MERRGSRLSVRHYSGTGGGVASFGGYIYKCIPLLAHELPFIPLEKLGR
jgi:hypothetical protein